MGLDIRTENDYARFNWSGSRGFQNWSEKKLKLNPFILWEGSNGEEYKLKKKDIKAIDEWQEALRKYCGKIRDSILEMGIGNIIGEVAYRVHDLSCESPFHREELIDWEYIQAIKWYFVLADAKKCGYIVYG